MPILNNAYCYVSKVNNIGPPIQEYFVKSNKKIPN